MIKVDGISKYFESGSGETVTAVDNLSFEVEDGELFTLLGPSGCGKTTTLRCLAGFEHPDEGTIEINGVEVSNPDTKRFLPPEERDIGFSFQSYAIWPHMTVRENIKFALKNRGYPKDQWEEKIEEALELVNLPDISDRYPSELSGGQQQRIAVARAISYEPALLLMDEPLSNLDFKERKRMRQELLQILEKINITTVYVTHNQSEAFEISDTVAVLNDGHKEQQGNPEKLYDRPKTEFVAGFIGDANIFDIEVRERLDGNQVSCTLPGQGQQMELTATYETADALGDPVAVIHPENISIANCEIKADGSGVPQSQVLSQRSEANELIGTVTDKVYRGGVKLYDVDVLDKTITAKEWRHDFDIGSNVRLQVETEDTRVVKKDPDRKMSNE